MCAAKPAANNLPFSIFHFCLMSFSLIYLFVAGFNQMVLIFHLDMYFVCSIKVCLSNFPLIFSAFKSFERFLYDMQVLQIWVCYTCFSDLDQTLEDLWEVFSEVF